MRRMLGLFGCPASIINTLVPYTLQEAKEAIRKSDIELLDTILKTKIQFPEEEENLLIYCLSQGKQEPALFLIREYSHLFQFNRRNDKGDTALMIAIFKKMHRAIKLLIDRCDPNACDFRRNTPFIAAAANGDIETLNLLREKRECKMMVRNDEGQSALHRACYFGQLEAIEWLLKFTELKVREKDKRGNNALHVACQGANIALTRYLMKKVKNSQRLLTTNYEGKTPLDVLMTVIESVAPHFQQNLNLSHLKPIEGDQLQ